MRIDQNDKVFKSDEYLKDRTKFYLIEQNLRSKELELHSDSENYIICRGSVLFPTWVWTKDNISNEKLLEVKDILNKYYSGEKVKLVSKREVYDLLNSSDDSCVYEESYFEMGFLECKSVSDIKLSVGCLSIPKQHELKLLSEYWYEGSNEMGLDVPTFEKAYREMLKQYESNKLYVWRDNIGNIVSLACFSIVNDIAKISHVCTPIKYRGNRFATSLIHELASKLINEGYTPLLYTDITNPYSNKAYITAGFQNKGTLIQYNCDLEKKKVK